VTVERIGGGTIESAQALSSDDFAHQLIQALHIPPFAPPFAFTRFVFLKQFREHANGDDACYQAIVEAPVEYPNIHGAHWLAGAYQADFFHYASVPLVGELGLAGANGGGTAATQKVSFAGLINFDFILGNGQTVWVAP
jgi:hypothetical protein